jgi:hypothetical protein
VDVQLAEQPAEGHVLVGRDVLVAEEDDGILGERAMQLVLLAVRQRLGEIDAGDLRADDRRQLVDGDGLVGRSFIGDVPIARAILAGERAEQVEAAYKIQQVYIDQVPEVVLYYRNEARGVNVKLQNFLKNPSTATDLWNVEDWWLKQ